MLELMKSRDGGLPNLLGSYANFVLVAIAYNARVHGVKPVTHGLNDGVSSRRRIADLVVVADPVH